jgi:hypothetical protein
MVVDGQSAQLTVKRYRFIPRYCTLLARSAEYLSGAFSSLKGITRCTEYLSIELLVHSDAQPVLLNIYLELSVHSEYS